MVTLETQEIQGIAVSGYRHLPYSKYFFLSIYDPEEAKSWLKQLLPRITTSDWGQSKPTEAINIALTHSGLAELGLPPETLISFSQEFIEGMTDLNRSRQLGDVGESHVKEWDDIWRDRWVHILLIAQAETKQGLEQFCREDWSNFGGLNLQGEETGYQDLQTLYEAHNHYPMQGHSSNGSRPYEGREHFGFRDAISQPEIEGSPKQVMTQDSIKAGEFILGYHNEDGDLPLTPTIPANYDVHNVLQPVAISSTVNTNCPVRKALFNLSKIFNSSSSAHSSNPGLKDFGRNGSYLVFRKLSQDVAGFRSYFSQFQDKADLMKAKVVGRWSNGAPLTLSPTKDNLALATANNFKYTDLDGHGDGCPLGAHIRRANPRDSLGLDPKEALRRTNRHRLLRRGALYGTPLPDGGLEEEQKSDSLREAPKDRGLLFFCINANIRRQFEFVQQTWINNPKFDGLYDEVDPLISSTSTSITMPKQTVPEKVNSLPNFVTVKGGEYFFLPSVSALRFLANYQG
jgi:deferrochelatase/peroxidase EfeB